MVWSTFLTDVYCSQGLLQTMCEARLGQTKSLDGFGGGLTIRQIVGFRTYCLVRLIHVLGQRIEFDKVCLFGLKAALKRDEGLSSKVPTARPRAQASSLLQAGEDGHCWAMGILRSFIEGKQNFLCIKEVKAGV